MSELDRYLELISLVERVHWEYLNLLKRELDRIGARDINSTETSILLNIGDARIAVNELRTRGNYLGSNVSYIVKQLIANGYLCHERSSEDLRVSEIWLSDKGRWLFDKLAVRECDLESATELENVLWALRRIEQFWIERRLERESPPI